MSKFIENISTLQNNTFALTPLLVSFYKNLKPTDKNILLAYFVLPLVLNNEFLEKIQKITTASNLSRITRDKDIMAGFEERFYFYKEQTNMCLQYIEEENLKYNGNRQSKMVQRRERIWLYQVRRW